MNIHYIPSSSYLHQFKPYKNPSTISSWTKTYHQTHNSTPFCSYKSNISYCYAYTTCQLQEDDSKFKIHSKKQRKRDDPSIPIGVPNPKKGTIAGAVALIVGKSIGSGILALPKKTYAAGLVPSSISLTLCWGFLLLEALLLVEINVGLLKKMTKMPNENGLEVISIRTMAQETLGELGGTLATLTYVFLGYTSMIAYASKSSEILYHMTNIPESILGFVFTSLFAILISVGGTRVTDQVNQVLTVSMIGLLVAIEVVAILFGGWLGFEGNGDWGKIPATIPVMIFSLVYHDLAPVLCAYLGGDIGRIRTSVILGSVIPLVGLLVWNAIALGLSSQSEPLIDPVELLMRERWGGIQIMVEAFSLLAVGTSLTGTLLSFSQFFKEQIVNSLTFDSSKSQKSRFDSQFFKEQIVNNLTSDSSSPSQKSRIDLSGVVERWWINNRIGFTATAMVVGPTLFVSTTVPDVFTAATDIAGGYCMAMLYGVLPPAMAWAMHNGKETDGRKGISRTRLALLGVGLFACGLIVEQILLDFSIFHS